MTRGKKLLALLLALIVLCGATYGVSQLNFETTVEETVAETVFALSDSVAALSWTYDGETLNFALDDEGEWYYADDTVFPLDDARLLTMVSVLTEITSTRSIEAVEDLSEYGLDDPECTIIVTTADGVTSTLLLGSESGLGDSRYLSLGADTVYLVDTDLLDYFTYALYDLVATESLPTMSDVTDFVMEAETGSLTLVYLEESGLTYTDALVWFATGDEGYTALDTDLTESFLSLVTGLSWSSCTDYYADDEELADYGLDSPTAVVTVTYLTEDEDGETGEAAFVLEIGGYASDSYCYARIADSRMVYLIASSVSDSLLYTGASDLLPTDILEMDWDTVDTLEITLNDVTYTLVRQEVTEETEDEDGEITTETTVTWLLEEEEIAIETILSTLNSLDSTDSAEDVTAERSEMVSFVFYRNTENFTETTLIFYAYDSSTCLVGLEGETRLFVSRTDIEELVSDLEELLEG